MKKACVSASKLSNFSWSALALAVALASGAHAAPVESTASVEEVISHMQGVEFAPVQVKSASDQASDFVYEQGLAEGWNPNQEMYIAVGIAEFDSQNPAYDDSFITKRSLKSMQALLEAKAQIIEFIDTEMTAIDKATTPGTDLSEQFRAEIEKLERKMNAQKETLAKLLAEVDQREATALQGVTFGDRMNSMMDATIKKLDEAYSPEKVEAEKYEKFEKAKARYQEAMVEYENLVVELEKTRGSVKEELSSKVETLSKQPLFGATTVAQFESWDEKTERYNVALVVVWGKKTERLARALIQGEDFPVPPGTESMLDWIRGNNWATSTGGRQFRDSEGNYHFVGISAAPAGTSSTARKKARGVAEQMAKKEVAMSIFADVESHKVAEQMMQTKSGGSGKDLSIAADSFSETLQQAIENRQIKGLQRRYGDFVVHPISQQEIYVAIYSTDSKSAKDALWMQERNYLTRLLDIKEQQRMKGEKAGMEAAVENAQRDQTEFNRAKASTQSSLQGKAAAERIDSTAPAGASTGSTPAPAVTERRSQSGSFSGAGQGGGLAW